MTRARTRFRDRADTDASDTDIAIGVRMDALALAHVTTVDAHRDLFDLRPPPLIERPSALGG